MPVRTTIWSNRSIWVNSRHACVRWFAAPAASLHLRCRLPVWNLSPQHTVWFTAINTIELPAKEFAVLHALMLNAGRVLSRAQIEEQLYAWGEEVESNAVEVYIHHLRRKLFPELIETIRGVGYLIPEDKNV